MPRRILITGGSGFIGTNVVDHYRAQGWEVRSVDPAPPRNPAHRDVWLGVNPADRQSVVRGLQEFDPEVVVHLGARTDLQGRRLIDYDSNIRGVSYVIDASRLLRNLDRVIWASSRMVCQTGYSPRHATDFNPHTVYGESKVVGEWLVRSAKLDVPWTIVRPTSIWGPWFDVPYKTFFLSVNAGRYVHVKGRASNKSFGFVGNSVYQLDRMIAAPVEAIHGRTLYLADYPPINTRAMAEAIRDELQAPPIRTVPMVALRPAALVGDMLRRVGIPDPPLTSFRLSNLVTEMVYDLSATQELAGHLPYSMEEGISITASWMRERGELG